MKKTNNKGFSLVELIIVIAIMAILAGAIAPALIRYIDKSRKSNDVSSCKTIKTAVETALGNEDVYAFLTNCGDDDANFTLITFNPGESTSTATMSNDAMTISGCTEPTAGVSVADVGTLALTEIGTNIGEKIPKLKYTKANKDDSAAACTVKPEKFYAAITAKGTVYVMIGSNTAPSATPSGVKVAEYDSAYIISPECCAAYQ